MEEADSENMEMLVDKNRKHSSSAVSSEIPHHSFETTDSTDQMAIQMKLDAEAEDAKTTGKIVELKHLCHHASTERPHTPVENCTRPPLDSTSSNVLSLI